MPKLLAISKNRTDTRIYVRGDKTINYGRVLEVMGRLSGAGFQKLHLYLNLIKIKKFMTRGLLFSFLFHSLVIFLQC